jgi:hypothetical protein
MACRNESLVSPRKDADPTIPILKQAKAEYAKLQQRHDPCSHASVVLRQIVS